MAGRKHLVYEVRSEGRVLSQFSSEAKARKEMKSLRKQGLSVRIYSKWMESDRKKVSPKRSCDPDTSINVYLKSKGYEPVERDMTFQKLYESIIVDLKLMEEAVGDCRGRKTALVKGLVEAFNTAPITERYVNSVLEETARKRKAQSGTGLWLRVLPDLPVTEEVAIDLQRCWNSIDDPFFLGAYRNGVPCDPDSRDSDLSVQPSEDGLRLCYREIPTRRIFTVLSPIEYVTVADDVLVLSGRDRDGSRLAVPLTIADAEKKPTREHPPFREGWYLVEDGFLLFVWNSMKVLSEKHARSYDRYAECTAVYPGFRGCTVKNAILPYSDRAGFGQFLKENFQSERSEFIDMDDPIGLRRALIENDWGDVRHYAARYPQLAILKQISGSDRMIGSKGKKKRLFSRNKKKEPADMVLNGYDSPEGTYLFDDGTIGMIGEPDFDIDDYLEDDEDPDDLEVRGMEPVGNIYIDRWKPGRFYDGGLYLYYKGETLRDYCERNGEPLPMRRLPDDVYDLIEDGKWDELKRYCDEVPELKRMLERV